METQKNHTISSLPKISNLIHSRSRPTSASRPLHHRPSDQPVGFLCAFFFFFHLKFFRNRSERGKGDGRVCHHGPVGTIQPAACSSYGYTASCWLSPTVCSGMSHKPLTQDIYLGSFPPSKYKSSLAQRLFVPSVDGERGKKTVANLSTSASARCGDASGDWRHFCSSLPPPAEMIMRSLIE